jgi:DNA-binding transcriptional regulator YiaG
MPAVIRFLGYDPQPEAETFPKLLVRVRRSLGLSQSQFAGRVGVPAPTLHAWEARQYAPSAARQAQVEARLLAIMAGAP